MVRLLPECGVNADVRYANGQTPKQIAIQAGYRRIVALLSCFGEYGKAVTVEVRFVVQLAFDLYFRITDIATLQSL